jgi:DNA repair exonuclease SbcCD ATPase subunit
MNYACLLNQISMKKWTGMVLVMFVLSHSYAQTAAVKALEQKDLNLKDRYALMKTNSQTFQDYKVIKEFVLDGVWKIYLDSVAAQRQSLASARTEIARLSSEADALKNQMAEQQASVQEITFDSTHVTVLGVSFHKTAFLTLVTVIVGVLVFVITTLLARLRSQHIHVREKTDGLELLTKEYEEYKRKSMEKQTKLARELQNERNKLMELRPH